MSSESGGSVVEIDLEELRVPLTEGVQPLEHATTLQKILDSPAFERSIEYAVLRQVKRAVNPGIKLRYTTPKEPLKTGILHSVRRLLERRVPATSDSDIHKRRFIPLPLNEITARELATVMHPCGSNGETSASWHLTTDEFDLHDHQDWLEQVAEVKIDACKNLGIVEDMIDAISVVPSYVMLHIGDGSEELIAWDELLASRFPDRHDFGVLRFILPSARIGGRDKWTLGEDSTSDSCEEATEFRTYYTAHYKEAEHKIETLSGARLELVYLLRFNGEGPPTTPNVHQRTIDILKSWTKPSTPEASKPWIVCTLQHREQLPRSDAIDIAGLTAADTRKVGLLTKLSTSWRSQFFLAHITIVKKWSIELEDIESVDLRIGTLTNVDGTKLEPPSSIPVDQILSMLEVNKLRLENCEREVRDNNHVYYQYIRVVTFLWPNKSHGRHVEPLVEGDKFLQKWLSDRGLDYDDVRYLKFHNVEDESEFASIALSLCRRGSSMKQFCLEAGLKILHPALYEAALPTTRTVDLIRRGVRRLGFDAMKPIIMRTLDIGVPDGLFEWCDYLLELRRMDLRGAMQMIDKLVHRLAKLRYINGIANSRPNPIIEVIRFFYVKHLPDTCEKLIRQIPYNCHQFWLPFIPQLRLLCNELRLMGGPDHAGTWVDMSLTALANYHSLPTPDAYLLEHPNQPLIPTKDFAYTPPTIEILGLCAEHGRVDLVRNIFRRILRTIMTPQSLLRCQLGIRTKELRFLKAIVISSYNVLKSTDTAFHVDPHGMFYGLAFTKYLLPALGRKPARHEFPEIECSCVFCARISGFLKSGEHEKSLQIPWPGHRTFHHITDNLPPRDDLSFSRDPKSQPPGIVLKKVNSEAMEQWNKEQRDLKELLKFLKPKKMVRSALGELYARVEVALKPGGSGWEWGVMESTIGDSLEWQGNKRRAEIVPGGPRKRMRTG